MSRVVLSVHRAAAVAAFALWFLPGCAPGNAPPAAPPPPAGPTAAAHDGEHSDHDHEEHEHGEHEHAHPETLADGVAALVKAAAAVKDGVAGDSRDAADDAVHDMGHLLEDLQGLVRTSTLADEAKATATKALDDLFDCFDKLDAALHEEPGKGQTPAEVHASIAERVAAAIDALRGAAGGAATNAGEGR